VRRGERAHGQPRLRGRHRAEELERPARNGTLLAENIRRIGGDPARLVAARHERGAVAAYLELHIEQGGTLDAAGVPIGWWKASSASTTTK
jgi:N-carbamoyl-L-amino-acid hydrolase